MRSRGWLGSWKRRILAASRLPTFGCPYGGSAPILSVSSDVSAQVGHHGERLRL